MFGAYLRATLTVGVAVLVAWLLQFLLPFFMPFLGPEDSLIYRSFAAIQEHALLIMIIAIAAGLIARAAIESRPGGI